MNKNSSYSLLLLLLFAATTGYLIYQDHQKRATRPPLFYTLLQRQGSLATTQEWPFVQSRANQLLRSIKNNPEDLRSSLALARLYMQEARASGNHLYYDRAVQQLVQRVLGKDPANFEALLLQAILLLSQHHFAEGLATAAKAQLINPYNADVYGLLVDGYIEMGNYEAAVSYAEKMISIRPDLNSYARISYLREIFGDYPGAIQAMQLAVEAGMPGDEATAWCGVQLGHLYELTGEVQNADLQYRMVLSQRPAYPFALAGLGRLSVAASDYATALSYYKQATTIIEDFSIKEGLAELYIILGQPTEATQLMEQLVQSMKEQQGRQEEDINHHVDQELAHAYLKMHRLDKALQHALQEFYRRPGNIDVNHTMAWVYYCRNEQKRALPFLKTALKTGSQNPVLLCHAGLIYAQAGEKRKARELLRKGLHSNSNIDATLKKECWQVLHQLQAQQL